MSILCYSYTQNRQTIKTHHLLYVLALLCFSCNSSRVSRTQLLTENKLLKEELVSLKTIDTSKTETVLELSKMNIVYRGVTNPVKISVPNAIKVVASAPGLKKIDEYGNYTFTAGGGKTVEVKIMAIMPNGDTIKSTKTLRIKNLSKLRGTINGLGCGTSCEVLIKKEQLSNALIDARLDNFLFDYNFYVTSFKIHTKSLTKSIEIEGNTITKETSDKILHNLKIGDIVHVFDIKVRIYGSSLRAKPPSPIIIKIVE
ncbi:GldM family protein [Pontimicrobium sp. IMCC45349]|uniref:GldM family protein n=1 Tax=Pontimicrobium sp. IMCC45349 TaxID=3391574 RepID=UPI0039A375E3